jgi:hypothetical protein
MTRQYWADAVTKNCVWLYQSGLYQYGDNGCTCGDLEDEDCDTCGVKVWHTSAVALTREEARSYGVNCGEEGKDWRIYGVPCIGQMAEILGRHAEEFASEVSYINTQVDPDLGFDGGEVDGC